MFFYSDDHAGVYEDFEDFRESADGVLRMFDESIDIVTCRLMGLSIVAVPLLQSITVRAACACVAGLANTSMYVCPMLALKVASSSASKACAQYVANVSGSAGDQALQEHTDSPSYLVRVVENVSSSSRNHYSLGNAVAYPSNHHHVENAT